MADSTPEELERRFSELEKIANDLLERVMELEEFRDGFTKTQRKLARVVTQTDSS